MTPKEQQKYIKKITKQLEELLRYLAVGKTPEQRDECRFYLRQILKQSFSTIRSNPNVNEIEYVDYRDINEFYKGKIRVPKEKQTVIDSKIKDLKSLYDQYLNTGFRQQRDLLKEHLQVKLSSAIHNIEDSEDVVEVEMPFMRRR